MHILGAILCLLVAAAGWYYMFYSRAAQNLSGIEHPQLNQRRVLLRRVNGSLMVALAVVIYIAIGELRRENLQPKDLGLFAAMMFTGLALMAGMLVLGLIDLRLTQNLRRRHRRDQDEPPAR